MIRQGEASKSRLISNSQICIQKNVKKKLSNNVSYGIKIIATYSCCTWARGRFDYEVRPEQCLHAIIWPDGPRVVDHAAKRHWRNCG